MVLSAIVRESDITPQQYREQCAEYDAHLPGWRMDQEGYTAAKKRLDPLFK